MALKSTQQIVEDLKNIILNSVHNNCKDMFYLYEDDFGSEDIEFTEDFDSIIIQLTTLCNTSTQYLYSVLEEYVRGYCTLSKVENLLESYHV